MSNPKEKAKELVEKFRISKAITESYAKLCALIAVDEIRSCINWNHYPLDREWRFWDEVKQEIEKL
jgi:hypothetical protein